MANNPEHPLLEPFYDDGHRGKILEERTQTLRPLRIRTHSPLIWDERYAEYIRRAGFLPLARLVQGGLPMMDSACLTALVDRWRPETHSFHLPAGEMTVTLQDVAMILGLRIDGRAVTGNISPAGWRDRVAQLLGVRPPDPPEGTKDRKTTGVSHGWISLYFAHPPPPRVDPAIVEKHARAWLWHLVGGFLFPDGSGNTLSWMWMDILSQEWEAVAEYSWGSATLAWLYRQMCNACRRTGASSNLGGCCYLLQIWMWERIPVGRPNRGPPSIWEFTDEGSLPTIAFLWKNILNVYGNSMRRYIDYSNELDCLLDSHVTWEPYERNEVEDMVLSPLCKDHSELWRADVPLICFFLVEYHLPCRVMRQFGYLQICPVEHLSTSQQLHNTDRRSQRGAKNWEQKHMSHINAWNNRQGFVVHGGPLHCKRAYREDYLQWLKQNSRLKLKVATDPSNIEDLPSDSEDSQDEYDELTRKGTQPQRGPIEDFIGQQLCRLSNEAGHALSVPNGDPGESSALRGFIERFRRATRRMARKLNCNAAPDQAFVGGSSGTLAAHSGSSRERSVPRTSSRTSGGWRTGTSRAACAVVGSSARGEEVAVDDDEQHNEISDSEERSVPRTSSSTSGGRPAGTSRAACVVGSSAWINEAAVDDDEQHNETGDSEENDPSYVSDIIGSSQMPDAPPTQTPQGTQMRLAQRRDHTDVVFSGNVLPTVPGRQRRTRKPYTPNPTPRVCVV